MKSKGYILSDALMVTFVTLMMVNMALGVARLTAAYEQKKEIVKEYVCKRMPIDHNECEYIDERENEN